MIKMTDFEIAALKRQWEAGVPIRQLVLMMPYKKTAAMKKIWQMQRDGILPERKRKRGADLVVEAYKRGVHNPYELAELYGYSSRSVKSWLSNARLGRKRPEHNWKKKDIDEKTKRILKCLESGMGVCETARKFGVSKQWVSAVKKRSENNG